MQYLNFLFEARSHPEQNPKISVNQAIIDYAADHNAPSFVSMTSLDKLGINPRSPFDTPIGIYAYPIDYVIKLISGGKSLDVLPYGGQAKYVNLFTASGNLINIDSLTSDQVDHYYDKLKQIWVKLSGSKSVAPINKLIQQSQQRGKPLGSVGGQFWYVTGNMAELITSKQSGTAVVIWSKLFRLLGIDGLIDNGAGIIRPKEPSQAVFFSSDLISDVERAFNKWSPQSVERGKQVGSRAIAVKQIVRDLSDQQIVDLFVTGQLSGSDINSIKSTSARLAVLRNSPSLITAINKPSDREQAVAIAGDYQSISHLDRAGVLTNGGVLGAIDLVDINKAKTIIGDVSRLTSLNPTSTFLANERLMRLMVDLDLHALRIIANKNRQKIPSSIVQYALDKLGGHIPTWLDTYATTYKLT